jgi:hypothetical protein
MPRDRGRGGATDIFYNANDSSERKGAPCEQKI